MSTSGKKKVTKAQVDAILRDVETKRMASPTRGKSSKQLASEQKTLNRNTAKVRKAQAKARQPVKLTQAEKKKRDDARLEAALTRGGEKAGRKGHDYEDLEDGQGKGKQAARDALRADEQSKALGKERKEDEGFLVKTLNFIGRPMFATAEAVNDNQEKYYRARHKGDNVGEALVKGFKAGFGGWGEGISGKKKTTFSKVIQEVADNRLANRKGIGAARSNEVKAKVNPVLKHGLGLTLDIFADPLTYTGVGAVAKVAGQGGKGVIKGADAVEGLKKTADLERKLVSSGAVTPEQAAKVVAASRAPVEAVKRRQMNALKKEDPAAYAVAQRVLAERKAGPTFKRKKLGNDTDYVGRTVEGLKLPTKTGVSDDVTVKVALEELGNVASKRHLDELTKKEITSGKHGGWNNLAEFKEGTWAYKAAIKENAATKAAAQAVAKKKADEAGLTPEALRSDLAAAMLRNISPDIKKQLKVRVGTASVGVKGTEKVAEILSKARHGKVEKAVDTFNNTFRASVKIAPSLNLLRNQELGKSSDRIRSHLITQQKVFDKMDAADAKAAFKDWASPYPNGSEIPAGMHPVRGPINNTAEYIDQELRLIQQSIDALDLTPKELGSWLRGTKIEISPAAVPGWKIGNKGQQEKVPENIEDWLIKHIRNNADKVDHPGRLLFALHAAVEHAEAKRSVYRSAAQHFGVPVRKSTEFVGHTGSKSLPNRLARDLVEKQGYKSVDLPGTEGMVFHPDVAEGMKKLDLIMNDRVTMDKWLKALDDGNQIFKGLVTRYNPSFHVRTLASELMLSYIGGMRNPAWSYRAAGKIMRGRNQEFLDPNGIINPAAKAAFAGDKRAVGAANTMVGQTGLAATRSGGTSAKVVFRHPKFGNLTADQVWGLYKNTGLKTGFATTDVSRSMDPLRKGGPISKVNDKLQDRFEDVEDFGRLAHFMDILKHSKHKSLDDAVKEATETVLKYHLDYTAVTQFEKTWATRAMPFYKWLRLSTPMILESLAHNPGKAMVAPKTLASLSEMAGYDVEGFGIAPGGADALVPEWMRDAGSLPMFNAFGDNQFFNPAQTVPVYGLLAEGERVQGDEDDPAVKNAAMAAFSKITPLLRAPAELATDTSSVGAPPSSSYTRYLANQTPQTALGGRMAMGTSDVDKRQQLLAFLANPGFQPNTPARMNSEAQQQKDKAINHRRRVKKELGIE